MTFEETEKALTPNDPCTIVIVKNESYLKSLQLLRDDVNAGRLRTIFFPVENLDLFDDSSEADVLYYHPDALEAADGFSYGEALLNTPRVRPDLIITEHTENQLSLKTGTLFGIHYAKDTPITEENSLYPVDSMIRFSSVGGLFALAVEGETIEESIRNLQRQVQQEVHEILSNNLKLAYMDGKRWTITPEVILLALRD